MEGLTTGGGAFENDTPAIIKIQSNWRPQQVTEVVFIYCSLCGTLIIRQKALLSHCQIQPIISSNDLQTHYCPFIHYFQMYMEHICQGYMTF